MSTNNPKHRRRSIRLPEYDYSLPGAYYITICVQDRLCMLGEIQNGEMRLSKFGKVVENWWRKIPERYPGVILDEYIIMPNHLHGIINVIGNDDDAGAIHELPLRVKRRRMTLPQIVGYFKMNSARQLNQMQNMPGHVIWQRNYWEHVIRNEKSLAKIREYIRNNSFHWETDEENPEPKLAAG